jgi:hypothetical protein
LQLSSGWRRRRRRRRRRRMRRMRRRRRGRRRRRQPSPLPHRRRAPGVFLNRRHRPSPVPRQLPGARAPRQGLDPNRGALAHGPSRSLERPRGNGRGFAPADAEPDAFPSSPRSSLRSETLEEVTGRDAHALAGSAASSASESPEGSRRRRRRRLRVRFVQLVHGSREVEVPGGARPRRATRRAERLEAVVVVRTPRDPRTRDPRTRDPRPRPRHFPPERRGNRQPRVAARRRRSDPVSRRRR